MPRRHTLGIRQLARFCEGLLIGLGLFHGTLACAAAHAWSQRYDVAAPQRHAAASESISLSARIKIHFGACLIK
jgi:hypothetical protein